jgi:signal transduction histidine kinase
MLHGGQVRYGRIWRNLPLQAKAAICLSAPLPIAAVIAALLSLLGVRQVQYLLIPGLALEFLAAAWLVENLLSAIRGLERAVDRMAQGEAIPEIPAHSWEVNGLGRKVESLAGILREQRLVAGAAGDRMARAFDDAPAACVEADSDGVVRRVNRAAAKLLRQGAHELCGKPAPAVWGENAGEGGVTDADSLEKEYHRPDGTRMLLSIQREYQGDGGAVEGIRYFLLDSTPRLLAQETMAQCERDLRIKDEEVARAAARAADADQARQRFLSNMSDELRVPLNGIIGFAELMIDAKVGTVSLEQRECLGDILSSARHLLRVLSDLLDLATTESGGLPEVRREIVNIEAVIQEVRFVTTVLAAQRHNVQIAVEVDPAVREAPVDAARFRQVVQNYLSAAVKLSPQGGSITVRAAPQGKIALRLEVEHSRAARHDQARGEVDPWHAADDAGLALAKQLVEEQGGRAGVHSAPGRGARLFAVLPTVPGVELPRDAVQVAESAAPESCEDAPPRPVAVIVSSIAPVNGVWTFLHPPGDPECLHKSLESAGVSRDGERAVLVVGRSLATLQSMLVALADLGYRPVCLRDVGSVLPAAAQEEPAAVVLDLSASGLEEFDFVEKAVRSVGLAMPVIGLLDRELTAADSAHLQCRALGVAPPRDGSARIQPTPLAAVRKMTA